MKYALIGYVFGFMLMVMSYFFITGSLIVQCISAAIILQILFIIGIVADCGLIEDRLGEINVSSFK